MQIQFWAGFAAGVVVVLVILYAYTKGARDFADRGQALKTARGVFERPD